MLVKNKTARAVTTYLNFIKGLLCQMD